MFTLEPEKWYAFREIFPTTLLGDEVADRFRPIYINKIIPLKTGKNLLDIELISFSGVERLKLKMLERSNHHLVASKEKNVTVIIQHINFDWLEAHCSDRMFQNPIPSRPRYDIDVDFYLDKVFCTRVLQKKFDDFADDRVVFECDDFTSAQAIDLPITVEARNLTDLWKKARDRVDFYLPRPQEQDLKLAFELKAREDDILIAWALRFDGYKYREEHAEEVERTNVLEKETIRDDPLLRMTHFFLLQRYLMKWGGEYEPFHGKAWRIFRSLFLMIANQPVPLAYRYPDCYEKWLNNYEPCTFSCEAVIRSIHERIDYDDSATYETPLPDWYLPNDEYVITC